MENESGSTISRSYWTHWCMYRCFNEAPLLVNSSLHLPPSYHMERQVKYVLRSKINFIILVCGMSSFFTLRHFFVYLMSEQISHLCRNSSSAWLIFPVTSVCFVGYFTSLRWSTWLVFYLVIDLIIHHPHWLGIHRHRNTQCTVNGHRCIFVCAYIKTTLLRS